MRCDMRELDLFYFQLLSEIQKKKAFRSYWTRTIFDKKKIKMERKLEKGFVGGLNSCIDILKKVKRDFDKVNNERIDELKERTFDE